MWQHACVLTCAAMGCCQMQKATTLSGTLVADRPYGGYASPQSNGLACSFFDRCCEDGSVATAFTNLRPAVIHRDLDMDNIMVDLQAQAVTGMVDFGDTMIMPPYYDLAAMYARLFPMPGRLFRHVLKGYAETAPAPTGAKPGTAVHEGAVNMCTVLDLAPRAVRRKARGGRVDEAMVVVKAIIAQSTAGPQTIQHGSGGEEHK